MSAIDLGEVDWLAGPLDRASGLTDALRAAPDRGIHLWAPSSIERLVSIERLPTFFQELPAAVEARRGLSWRFPVLVAQVGSADDLDRAPLSERGVLVLVHPSGAAQVAPLFPIERAPRMPLAIVDPKRDPHRTMPGVRLTRLEAAHRFALANDEPRATYTLFLVIADRVSSGCQVTISNDAIEPAPDSGRADRVDHPADPPTAGASVDLASTSVAPLRISPAALQSGSAASEPRIEGFALHIDRYLVRREHTAFLLRGEFRLPVPPSFEDGTVELLLVATGAARPRPEVASVRANARIEGADVVGSFVLDVSGTPLLQGLDTFFVHAFIGAHAAIPAITTVVPDPG